MSQITDLFAQDHAHCDELFADAEDAAAKQDWAAATRLFGEFRAGMDRHFAAEEETLFPTFEDRTGMRAGPTQVMRSEHEQMRGLMEQMQAAVESRNDTGYLGLSETLLMLMRQHNLKEEQILYPMTDQVLAGDTALLDALDKTLHPA